ncbi:MAG: class I SAM-dependent methyltransferase [Nanoarchaeota archaeon]|nr:class I SAM-dependent methyltransferase [Nanoarchaeota archaeon]
MKKLNYSKKKEMEKAWHEQTSDVKHNFISRILHHPVFYKPERNSFNYIFPKEQMTEVVQSHLKGKKIDKLLIAPCGKGNDIKYLGNFANQVYGIDLSPIAIKKCPTTMKVKVGDILDTKYPNETFDIIASPLFFHHLLNIGFEHFLNEFYRIMKKKGKLIILEPSVWYPLNIITRPIKRVFGNPFGEIEDEAPFHPGLMLKSLKNAGFTKIEMRAATFSHCSFYIPLAKTVNFLTKPFLNFWPLKYFAWMVVYYAEKE